MNQQLKRFAIPGLRWAVGVVVLLESVRFVLSPSAAHHIAQVGLPPWIRPALGGSEIIAALLFLVPAAADDEFIASFEDCRLAIAPATALGKNVSAPRSVK